jgi:hypothetical protein
MTFIWQMLIKINFYVQGNNILTHFQFLKQITSFYSANVLFHKAVLFFKKLNYDTFQISMTTIQSPDNYIKTKIYTVK